MPGQAAVGNGDADSWQPAEEGAECHLQFHPGEVCPQAEVRSVAEGYVRIGVTTEVKLIGTAEYVLVTVRRAAGAENWLACPDEHVPKLDVRGCYPRVDGAAESPGPARRCSTRAAR